MWHSILWLVTISLLSFGSLSAAPAVALVVPDESEPENFDFIGVYLVKSVVRVRAGKIIPSPPNDTRYRVYSNGQDLRVYQSDVSEGFHSYSIYRSDGISEQDAQGNIVIAPGIQARHISPDMLKQLSITQKRLTITQFPPISDTVVVIYAKRLEVGTQNR